jgi:hypothetical protein
MSSIREQIAAAIVAVLDGSAEPGGTGGVQAPSGLTVSRERTRPIERDKLPATLIYFEDEEPTPIEKQKFQAPITQRHLNVVLEMRAVAGEGLAPDEAIDPLYLWAMQQIFADEKFGGLAMGVTEGPMKWTAKEADAVLAGAALHLTVHYRTSRLDPSSVG